MSEKRRRLLDRITNRDTVEQLKITMKQATDTIKVIQPQLETTRVQLETVTQNAAQTEQRLKADLSLSLFRAFAQDTYADGSAMRIPFTNPSQGGSFGEVITDASRLFASQREPVIKWLVNWIASDIFDNWFKVKLADEKATEDENNELDRKVQAALIKLDAKRQLTRLTIFERRYGWSILLLAYTDTTSKDVWRKPLKNGGEIKQITPYSKTQVTVQKVVENPKDLRLGLPEIYTINRGAITLNTEVHYTRLIHDAPRLDEHPYEGVSIIDAVYDDATGYRNIRWSEYQAMYRYGTGFPHITIPNATREQIQQWIAAGYFKDLFTRSYFVSATGEDIQFKGVQSVTLNPEPYNKIALDNLAIGSRIPQDVLKGVSAGAVTGSEVNERAYHKLLSAEESDIEFVPRDLIDRLMDSGQIEHDREAKPYKIVWNSGFEINEKDEAQIELWVAQTRTMLLNYKTVNEVRLMEGLEEIDGGDVVLGLLRATMPAIQTQVQAQTQTKQPTGTTTGDVKVEAPRKQENLLEEDLDLLYAYLKTVKVKKDEALGLAKNIIIRHVDAVEQLSLIRLSTITGKALTESSPEAKTLKLEQIESYMKYAESVIGDIVKD